MGPLTDGLKKKSPGSPRERAQPQLPPSGERWGCLGEASPLHSLLVILTLSVVQAPLLATRVLCYLRGLQRDRPPGKHQGGGERGWGHHPRLTQESFLPRNAGEGVRFVGIEH